MTLSSNEPPAEPQVMSTMSAPVSDEGSEGVTKAPAPKATRKRAPRKRPTSTKED